MGVFFKIVEFIGVENFRVKGDLYGRDFILLVVL